MKHITRISKQHVKYLRRNSKLGKFALEKYKMATFESSNDSFFSTNGKEDSKMSAMGSALMNMIRKNKKKDSSNQEEKKSRSSDSSSNEMFEKIYSELKSISKRLGDLEGRVDSGKSSTTRKSNIDTTRNINTMKKSNIMKKQSNRTEKTRAGNVRTENKRRNVKHVIEAYDRRRLQRLVRKRNEESSKPVRKGKEEESKPTQKPSSK